MDFLHRRLEVLQDTLVSQLDIHQPTEVEIKAKIDITSRKYGSHSTLHLV
jgi:hypothetical protein